MKVVIRLVCVIRRMTPYPLESWPHYFYTQGLPVLASEPGGERHGQGWWYDVGLHTPYRPAPYRPQAERLTGSAPGAPCSCDGALCRHPDPATMRPLPRATSRSRDDQTSRWMHRWADLTGRGGRCWIPERIVSLVGVPPPTWAVLGTDGALHRGGNTILNSRALKQSLEAGRQWHSSHNGTALTMV